MSYSQAKQRQELAPQLETHMSCRWCGKSTLITTLNQYGARCFECYETYCRNPPAAPSVMGNKAQPKSWAPALKKREMFGERLSAAQRVMWRASFKDET